MEAVAKLLCHLSLDKISSEEIFESVIIYFFGGYQLYIQISLGFLEKIYLSERGHMGVDKLNVLGNLNLKLIQSVDYMRRLVHLNQPNCILLYY